MMPNYRGMSRGFCLVSGSFGFGTGHIAVLLRFKPESSLEAALRSWLLQDVLPQLPSKPGVGSVHLLERAAAPTMTNEQRIRGADAGVDWALLLTGYSEAALSELVVDVLRPTHLERRGVTEILENMYRIDYSLVHGELDA